MIVPFAFLRSTTYVDLHGVSESIHTDSTNESILDLDLDLDLNDLK